MLGCGEPDLLLRARCFLGRRVGKLKVEEESFAQAGAAPAREKDFPAAWTEEDFTNNLNPPPTSPELWAGREEPLSSDEIKLRQCKLGELRWVATESRPAICARLTGSAPRINSLCGSDARQINGPVRAAKEWRIATVLESASSSRP